MDRCFTKKAMKNFCSLEGYTFFVFGWVQEVFHQKLTSDSILFKAQIEAAVRLGVNKTACTDRACAWNQFSVKKVEPKRIASVSFFSLKASSSKRPAPPLSNGNEDKQAAFIMVLGTASSSPVVLSTFKEYAGCFHAPSQPPARQMPPLVKELAALGKTTLTKEKVDFVESATCAQSSVPMWYEQRVWWITASIAHCVLHTAMDDPTPSIIKARNSTIMQHALDDKDFFMDSDGCLKTTHKHYTQVRFQMLMTQAKYADFVVFAPSDMIVQRIPRNAVFIQEMEKACQKFWIWLTSAQYCWMPGVRFTKNST
ncbi:hypothetical protein CAPTEDRAFT_191645 [Capitella teleta]|uniref:Uncharacterized protein n=1 Tax=Capitella teleta TaxID=283909 RepID=R7VHB2_CAPTE|nr:hypothetical protein CAPTEDRAFT_191645 [Capitella teleta]|eukprot:ELU17972.1 hypothetical protein CAPTEDRAFT_191645 [Capitella teleta]